MAFYQRFMLAPLKLTQRPDAARMLVYRGVATTRQQEPSASNGDSIGSEQEPSASAEENMGQELSVDSSETTVVQDFLPDSPPIIDEPTHHELQSKANVRGWEQLRSRFLSVRTECSAMPFGQLCLLCPNQAEFRCQECGPLIFYCRDCFCSRHEKVNLFHVAERWEVRG